MFYEVLKKLCEEKGISVSAAVEAIQLQRSAATSWKKGAMPSKANLAKLAEYFGVTSRYLLEGFDPEMDSIKTEPAKTDSGVVKKAEAEEKRFSRRSRYIDHNYLALVLGIAKIYHPDESIESLAHKFGMTDTAFQSYSRFLEAPKSGDGGGCFRFYVDDNWVEKLHSIFPAANISRLISDLPRLGNELRQANERYEAEIAVKIASECMYKHNIYNFEIFETHFYELPRQNWDTTDPINHECFANVEVVVDEDKKWLFSSCVNLDTPFDSLNIVWSNRRSWLKNSDIERFYFMFSDICEMDEIESWFDRFPQKNEFSKEKQLWVIRANRSTHTITEEMCVTGVNNR